MYAREFISDGFGKLVENLQFGKVSLPGGKLGNLGESNGALYDVRQLDFDTNGRLYGLEMATGSLVQVGLESFLTADGDRLELVLALPESAEYRDLNFDISALGSSLPGAQYTNAVSFYLVRTVEGDPLGSQMQIRVDGGAWQNHTFGGDQSEFGDIIISSATINGGTGLSYNSAAEVTAAGGYYRFDVSYPTGIGLEDVVIDISDIDWGGGSQGNVDAVFLDGLNATLENYGPDSLSVRIDSELGDGELTIYFGATSDLLFASSVQSMTDLVVGLPWQSLGVSPSVLQIPEDGDYVLQIIGNITAAYQVTIRAFNDGNSDFGITETAGDDAYRYDPAYPNDRPVDLGPIAGGNTDLVANKKNPTLYTYNPALTGPCAEARMDWPIRVEGSLLTPGQASHVMVDSELTNVLDVDIYRFELVEGQFLSVDIESKTLFGNNNAVLSVGIYNADLELLASAVEHEDDTLSAAQQADPFYQVQAIYQMPNHTGPGEPVIDPMNYDETLDARVGIYYVVVAAELPFGEVTDTIDYQLKITTTDPEPVEAPPSQLVWLSFGDPDTGVNAKADHLARQLAKMGSLTYADVVKRPAFDPAFFGLEDVDFDFLVQQVADRIEQIYRNAGLTEDEIEFTTIKPGAPGSPYGPDAIYTTVIFGGKIPGSALGLAQDIDRNNSDRTDTALILTDSIGEQFHQDFDDDPDVKFGQVVNVLSFAGAHELGHILGMQHATQVDVSNPTNIMGYNENSYLIEQDFAARNSLLEFSLQGEYPEMQPGFENEIDMLLRVLGSGTLMGK